MTVRQVDRGLQVLRVPLEGKGETLPVFTGGQGDQPAEEAPGWGRRARSCTFGEPVFLPFELCSDVEWITLDAVPGRSGGMAASNAMSWEDFVDYLLYLRVPCVLWRSLFETVGSTSHRHQNVRWREEKPPRSRPAG